jgi:hypothetical protein
MNWLSKKRRNILIVLAAVCIFAVGAIYADLQIGYYAPANLGTISQAAPDAQQASDVYKISAFPLYTPTLVPGAGRQDVKAYCNTCHTPSYVTMQPPLPAATWKSEVDKMGKAFGAQIPAESQASILKYLDSHYTPETRKR